MKKEVGFIPEYRDFILEHIPTSSDWAESIAISMLSTAVGGDKFVRSKIGHLPLNLWFLMIGPSGMAFKSTPLKYFVFPFLTKLTDEIGQHTIVPNRYSVEGFIEYLSSVCSQGAMVRDEFTGIFKETNKGYLSDNLEFLSELYDGTIQKRYTRKAKLEHTTNVYITFLTASTPYLYRVMKPEFFVQGTGNRILVTLFEGLNEKDFDESEEDFFYDTRQDTLREEKIEKYAEYLGKVFKSPLKQLVPVPAAGKMWLVFRKRIFMEAKRRFKENTYDLNYTYMVRLPEFCLKLSALHAISRYYKSLKFETLPIVEDDMDWAIKTVEKYYRHFKRMIEAWSFRPDPEEPRTIGDAEAGFYSILSGYPSGMSWEQVRNKIKWKRYSLYEILLSLYDQHKVLFAVGKSTGKGGRKPTLLFAKEYKEEASKHEEVPSWEMFAYRTHLKT